MKNCKKTIGIDATPFVYGRGGGYNEYIYSLLDGIIKNDTSDLNITIIIRDDQFVHFSNYHFDFNFIKIKARSTIQRVILQNVFFPFFKKIDLFIFTGNFAPLFQIKPYILVTHDLNYKFHPKNFSSIGRFIRKFITWKSIKSANASISISKQTSREIKNEFNVDSITIYNPVRSSAKKYVNSNNKILCMTSLAVHKNVEEAYAACLKFATENPEIKFDFIGNWREHDFPSNIRHPNISLHGFVDDLEKESLISNASCILSPSVYEGFGMPYVEAMLMNKCLICSDIDIANEITENYPYYIKYPFKCNDIFNALLEASNNNFTPKHVESSHINQFTPINSSKKYLEISRAILKN